ncbi:phosphotransferase [Spongisporangium articulatum]|uniref:Phosphotransferase n=1 Tax=Spongisporangium articulatum TaxID=3362603 RepID=A0ABW8AS96_9ACTN
MSSSTRARRSSRSAASLTDADIAAVLDRVPCVADSTRTVQHLEGGLTNVIVKVVLAEGTAAQRTVVARLGTDDSAALAIDRDAEHGASRAAAASGAAPDVVCRSVAEEVLVVAWVEGRTLGPADVRRDDMLPRLADVCRTLHAGPRFPVDFDMFDVQGRYLRIVQERGFRLPAGYLDLMPAFERMRAALAVRPAPTVPCHNDLLAENFLDDGNRLWVVDFEYAGNNEPAFELGNIASESGLSVTQLAELVRLYRRADDVSQVAAEVARARLLATASKYGWTLWGCIQAGTSTLDFDFWAWGLEKYERAVEEFAAADFGALLEEVAA